MATEHQSFLGKDTKGYSPVQADGKEGDVHDGPQSEAEVANDLTNCLCLRPKNDQGHLGTIPNMQNKEIRQGYLPVTRVN